MAGKQEERSGKKAQIFWPTDVEEDLVKKRRSRSEAEKAEDPGRLVGKGIDDRGNGFRAGDSQ